MKVPPVSYYGGKQRLVSRILPMIPTHARYNEPFLGGGAVFWAKEKSAAESINDLDGRVVNFYQVVQNDFDALARRIHATCHSEMLHQRAAWVLKAPCIDPVDSAWAFWLHCNMGFSSRLLGGFAFDQHGTSARKSIRRARAFTEELQERMLGVEVFSRDALQVIDLKDAADTFHYIDPPYVSSDCGHYKGYTRGDFAALLNRLKSVEGKFLLSSYPEDDLADAVAEMGWQQIRIEQTVAVSGKRKTPKLKTECLTYNYELPQQ